MNVHSPNETVQNSFSRGLTKNVKIKKQETTVYYVLFYTPGKLCEAVTLLDSIREVTGLLACIREVTDSNSNLETDRLG
jgi:hypothetical protein